MAAKQKKRHDMLKHEYKQWLVVGNFKPRGIEEKIRHADYFLSYLEENSLDAGEITYTKACAYREYLVTRRNERGMPRFCSASINVQLANLGMFYRYLLTMQKVYANPFSETERVREAEHLPKTVLTVDEMGDLLSSLPAVTKEDMKARTAVEVLYATGMRIVELENLRKEDCDMERGVVYVRDDKNRQDRICVLTEYAHRMLFDYLKENTMARPFHHGAPRSFNRFLNIRLKRECGKLGLSVITCHGIRHTVATHLLKKGADLREVQEFLGHKRIRNTEKYTRLTHEDLKKVVESFHPREREQS